MRPALAGALCALFVLPIAPLAALAQEGRAPSSVRIESVDVSAYPEVEVAVSVPSDLEGALDASSLRLSEDGAARQAEVELARSADLQVVLLLDTTDSMTGGPLDAAKAAAMTFLQDLPEDARVAVYSYDTTPTVVTGFDATRDQHATGVMALEAGGRTAMYDAVEAAANAFPVSNGEAHRAIVLLTDGEDNASSTSLPDVADKLAEDGISLHGVAYQTLVSDHAALQELADASGGTLNEAADSEALSGVYRQLASDLTSRYLLRYRSAGSGTVRLAVDLRHGERRSTATRDVDLPTADPAATKEPARLQIVSIDTSAHPDVDVRVIAPRQLSNAELDQAAFTVVENGSTREIEAAKVTALEQEVILAIDTSGSMQGSAMEAAKEAATTFLTTMPSNTRVAIHSFDSTPNLVLDFTDDVDALTAAVESLIANGETALYDAAVQAVQAFADRPASARSLVLLSDGGDTVSQAARADAVAALAASGIALHAIELQTAESDPSALQELAAPSQGTVTSAADPGGLAEAYSAVAGDIANQYVIRYRSAAAGSAAVEVGVSAAGVTASSSRAVDLPRASGLGGFLGSRSALIIGAVLWYVALALIILSILTPRARAAQLRGAAARIATGKSGLSDLAAQASHLVQQTLQRGGKERGINAALERAGINLRPGEYVLLLTCATITALALGMFLAGPLGALLLAGPVMLAGRFGLSFLGNRRQAKFADQLGETLQLLAGSLRAGYSLMQAIDAVAREADAPSSEEFRRLVVETRLGRELGDSLRALGARTGSEDFAWVLQAIEINREVGGDLAEVLDTVAGTIRERNQIRRQVKALSAEGVMSAYILIALPIGVGLLIAVVNPSYMAEFTNGGILGLGLMGIAAFMMAAGALWLRKLVKIKF